MAYLLDANVFIQAKNLHYGFDFCPAFWDWLEDANRRKIVFSIEKVQNELIAGKDDLSDWVETRGSNFFLPPDEKMLSAFSRVSQWVNSRDYDPAAVNTFFQVADYYLIAYALAHEFTIVTHEVPAHTRKKVKIPNVCIAPGIKHMTPYEMLRREGARFILERT